MNTPQHSSEILANDATVQIHGPVADKDLTSFGRALRFLRRNPTLVFGLALLATIATAAVAAPILVSSDPIEINIAQRLKPPSAQHWFGTDMFGRDVYARTLYGGRVSLIVGLSVATIASTLGMLIGLVSGYIRYLDGPIMRLMDGLMAIPGILLAIALIALLSASITNVIIALTIPQVPRVARLVRSVVLSLREQVFVEAAVSIGATMPRVIFRHIMPNTLAPILVQATFVCASAILIEAALSFLGAGTPAEVPSWGNMMAEGKVYLQTAVWIIVFPGLTLSMTVLATNMVGDGLRDLLDPKLASRM